MDKILNKPCPKCPYKLGLVRTFEDPCPECEVNGYSAYKWFVNCMQKGIPPDIMEDGLKSDVKSLG